MLPDKELREYKWAREIAARVEKELLARGIAAQRIVTTDKDVKISERVSSVNRQCQLFGSKNLLLVSIHINAAGADGKWHDANGWSVFVSKNASSDSKAFAKLLTSHARKMGLKEHGINRANGYSTWSWTKADIAILKNTRCPAVLTENFFQDNLADKKWLMSEAGKVAITKLHVDAITEWVSLKTKKQ